MQPIARWLVQRLGVHRASLAASVGSLLVLVGLALAVGLNALATENAIEDSRAENTRIAQISDARAAIGRVHGTLDIFLAAPTEDNRQGLRQAAGDLRGRLHAASLDEHVATHNTDRLLAVVQRLMAPYLRATAISDRMKARSDRIHAVLGEHDTSLARHERLHLDASTSLLAALHRRQERTLTAIPIAVLLGVLVLALLWSVGVEARNAELRREAEIALWAHEALTDELTGARNRRAFRDDLAGALSQHARSGAPLTLAMLDVDGLKAVNDLEGHQAGDRVLQTVANAVERVIRDCDALYRLGGDEFALLLPGTGTWGAMTVVQRLHLALVAAGGPKPVRVSVGIAEAGPRHQVETLMRFADEALLAAKRSGQGVQVYTPTVQAENLRARGERTAHYARTLATALARAVDAKDSYTRSHSETVAALCGLIGTELGFSAERLERLKLAGLLHDVGKIGISDAILQKPARLTPEEYETMKAHSKIGHDIVASAEFEDEALWVKYHHERIDGMGYPAGLGGEDIPLESRIIHVADAFEAMTSDRPYRSGMPTPDAIAELKRHTGTQFDQGCVEAFLRAWSGDLPDGGGRVSLALS